jgi:hypothetical protein
MAASNQDGTTIAEYRAEHAPPSWSEVFGSRVDALPDPFAPRSEGKRKPKSTAVRMAAAVARGEAEREAEREKLAKAQRREARKAARDRAKYAGLSSAEVLAHRAGYWGEQDA